jgi:hypothetical protein
MMRILCVSDTVDERIEKLAGGFQPWVGPAAADGSPLAGVALVLAAGDLPGAYLEFLVDLLDVPLYFVFGNHGEELVRAGDREIRLPLGCVSLEGRTARHPRGAEGSPLLLAGLGGSRRYRPGPYQHTEAEMLLRVLRLVPALWWNRLRVGRYLDVLLTHAPPWGIQDGSDGPHRGFRAFLWLMDRFRPRFLVHGHYDAYDRRAPARTVYRETAVVNAYGSYLLEVEDVS